MEELPLHPLSLGERGTPAGDLPRSEEVGTPAGDLPRSEEVGTLAGDLPRSEEVGAQLAPQEEALPTAWDQ